MAKAITAIDVITGGPRGQKAQRRWFWRYWSSGVNNDTIVFTSPVFKSGVTVHQLKIEHLNETNEIWGRIEVRACVTSDANLTWAGMLQEKQIIEFPRPAPNNGYLCLFRQTQTEFDMLRRYEGANLRLAIGYRNSGVDTVWVESGLLFSEP